MATDVLPVAKHLSYRIQNSSKCYLYH